MHGKYWFFPRTSKTLQYKLWEVFEVPWIYHVLYMTITLNIDSFFCIISMILGFFLSIIFLRLTNRKRIANIIISVFYFVTSIAIGCNPLLFTNLYQVLPHAIRIEWILLSLICPLLHLYYITFVYNRLKLALIDIILLISTGVFILSMLPFYFQSPAAKIAYYRSILAGNFFLSDLIFANFLILS